MANKKMSTYSACAIGTKKIITMIVFLAVFYPLNLYGAPAASTNYQIWADSFNVGGSVTGDSTNYSLIDTIGEGVIGNSSISANYIQNAGFQEMLKNRVLTFTSSATSIELGELSSSSESTAGHSMSVYTNASNGVAITMSGNTLTSSGGDTIDATGASGANSNPGNEQFGISLTTSGTAPIAAVAAAYSSYAFSSGDTVVSSTGAINTTSIGVTYLANISDDTASEVYTTTITYTATATY